MSEGMQSRARFSIVPSRAFLDEKLTPLDLRVLGVIGFHLGVNSNEAFPKQSTIAEKLGKSREGVNRSLKRLVEGKYIEVRHRFREDGLQTSNVYKVLLDVEEDPQDLAPEDHTGTTDSVQEPDSAPDGELSPSVDEIPPGVTPKDHTGCDPCDHTNRLPTITPHYSPSPQGASRRGRKKTFRSPSPGPGVAGSGAAGSEAAPTGADLVVERRRLRSKVNDLVARIGFLETDPPYSLRKLKGEQLQSALAEYRSKLEGELLETRAALREASEKLGRASRRGDERPKTPEHASAETGDLF